MEQSQRFFIPVLSVIHRIIFCIGRVFLGVLLNIVIIFFIVLGRIELLFD